MQNGAGSPTLADLLEEEEQAAPPPVPTPDGDKPPVPRARLPVPAAAARARAESSVKEVFGEDLEAATTPDAKKALCAKLLGYADESTDHVTRFVLLGKAWRLSVDASDLDEAVKIGRRLAETYEVNGTDLEIQALKTVASGGPTARLGPAVDGLLAAARVVAETDVGRAEELAQAAAMAARKAKDRERGAAAVELLAELKDAKKREQRIKPLRERLQESPNDAEAATELGCILCFEDEDWDQGLSLLKKGNDSDLATLAQRDLAAQAGNASSILAADAWWDHGKSNKGAVAAACLQRARFHYLAALDDAKGLDRAKIEKRLQSLDQEMKTKGAASNPMAQLVGQIGANILWLDANDPRTVLGEGNKPIKSGPASSSVAAWMDRNGKPVGMAVNAPESRPTVVPSRGSRAIVFDGKDDYLVGSKWPQSLKYPVTVSIVYALSAQALADVRWRALFDNAHRADLGFVLQFRPDSGGYTMIAGTAEAKAAASSDWQVVTAVFGQHDSAIYVGKRLAASTAGGSEGKAVQPVCFLGCWGSPTGGPMENRFFAGAVGECLVFGKALSQKEVEGLAGALEAKWQK